MTKDVYTYLQTHWDREWYKTFEAFRLRLCDVSDDIFQKIDNNEIPSFYLDGQVVALEDYLKIHSDKFEYVKNLIKSKKLFIGPFYDLADEFLVNGESLSRNLLFGIYKAKSFGADENDFIGYLPDAFGHCAMMPMLLKKCGINNAIVWRGVKSNTQEFFWLSPDGSKIKTVYLPIGYFQDFLHKKTYKNNLKKILSDLEKYTDKNTPILLPVGGDHLACADNIKAKIKNFNRNNKEFHIKLSSLKEYFDLTGANNPKTKIQGELRNNETSYILMGTASSRIDLKQLNMLSQWKLGKVIEPLYAMFSDTLPNKKANIDYAWQTLIKNHAHDSICGCSLDEVHEENILRYKKVLQICDALYELAQTKFSEKISNKEVGIINLSNFDYSGVYSFYSDKKLPLICVGKKKAFPAEISQDLYQAPVQEHYRYYYEYLAKIDTVKKLSAKTTSPSFKASSSLSISTNSISNEFLDIHVNADGTINIKNKISGVEFQNILRISDEADVGDSYNFSCILEDKPIFAEFKNSKILESNPLRKILRLEYYLNIPSHAINNSKRSKKCHKHIFIIDLILCDGAKRLDIKINYENFSKDHILKVNFNLPQNISKVTSEDTFGVIERSYPNNYDYKKQLPLPKYKEANINTGIFQRFVMAQGLCVITKGLQEYEVKNKDLNITLLRSFGVISKKTLLTRTAAAGPPLPTPKGQMLGKQTAEMSLVLTDNEKEAFEQADFFYNPLITVVGRSNKTNFYSPALFNNLPDNLYLHNLKTAENAEGLIAKIFNYTDKNCTLSTEKAFFETNLLEQKLSENRCKKITLAPSELKVIKIK